MKNKQRKITKKKTTVSFRVLWSKVKRLRQSWAHIRCSIAGGVDTVTCTVCDETRPLGPRRESTVLEMARTHYYKHKLFNQTADSDGGGGSVLALFKASDGNDLDKE